MGLLLLPAGFTDLSGAAACKACIGAGRLTSGWSIDCDGRCCCPGGAKFAACSTEPDDREVVMLVHEEADGGLVIWTGVDTVSVTAAVDLGGLGRGCGGCPAVEVKPPADSDEERGALLLKAASLPPAAAGGDEAAAGDAAVRLSNSTERDVKDRSATGFVAIAGVASSKATAAGCDGDSAAIR